MIAVLSTPQKQTERPHNYGYSNPMRQLNLDLPPNGGALAYVIGFTGSREPMNV